MLVWKVIRVLSLTRTNPLNSIMKFDPLHNLNLKPSKSLKMSSTEINSKRPTCPTCSKPARVCFCTRIRNPGHENKVHVTILQHSLEKKHPLNSSRIVKLGLKNVTLEIVSDVNFRAQFLIRLIELGLLRPRCGSSGLCLDLKRIGTQKRKVDDVVGFSKIRESEIDYEFTGAASVKCSTNNGLFSVNVEESVITARVGKNGKTTDLHSVFIEGDDCKNIVNFDRILDSRVAADMLLNGFVVKKLQEDMLNEGLVEEKVEFELVVPRGSVLLFPSEQALSVEEVKEMGLEVKNLIVLDGTWPKARRMYEENPWLRLLPHLKLDSVERSLYAEVRHQPKSGYLSTLESVVYALKAVGDDCEVLDGLLDAFESMVADQRSCKDERLSKASLV